MVFNFNDISNLLNNFVYNDLYFFILLILLIERFKRICDRNLYTAWLFILPGTFLHELTHYIVALLLNGKPTYISLVPNKRILDNGKVVYFFGMAYVKNIRWYNTFFIGMSPLLLLIVIYFFNYFYYSIFEDNLITKILYIYLMIVLIDSSIPSFIDFKIAFSKAGFLIGLIFLTLLIFYINYEFDIVKLNF